MGNSCRIQGLQRYAGVICASALLCVSSGAGIARAEDYTGEKIVFGIMPLGRAEYTNLGTAEIDGKTVDRVTFRTQAMGFDDTETIYSDPQSHLPVQVDRAVSRWLGNEHLVERYDQRGFVLTIDKFKRNRKIKQYVFKEDGPIHNAILLPFYLRTVGRLDIGWEIRVRIPEEFTVRLSSIEKVSVPAGKFMAYHFTSTPPRFEIWISQDELRLPLKIRGLGSLNYTMVMKKHVLPRAGTSVVP